MGFNLHDFVLETIYKMIGNEPDYKVMQYSLVWLNRGVLTELDLSNIQAKIDEKNKPEEIPEELPAEDIPEDKLI